VSGHVYVCQGIDFAYIHDFSIGCWNFSNSFVLSVMCLAYAMKGE
jgi:hypothetical protein